MGSKLDFGLSNIKHRERQKDMYSCGTNYEYRKLLAEFDLPDPKNIAPEVDDITSWPPVTLVNIFQYILSMQDFNTEYVDEEAYSYFDGGFVGGRFITSHKKTEFLFCDVRVQCRFIRTKNF